MPSDTELDETKRVALMRDIARRFGVVSQTADEAAKAAPRGHKASAYAKVMTENGYLQLNMAEVRRLVGEE